MTLLLVPLLGLIGFVAGPTVHELAVSTGAGEPRRWRPRCRQCGEPLPWSAWWAGRCPVCGTAVPPRVAVTSLLTGIVVAGVPFAADLPLAALPAYVWFLLLTAALVLTDLDHRRIPNRLTYPGSAVGAVLLVGARIFGPSSGSLLRAAAGAAVTFGVFLLVGIVARGGLGMGDVKLMGVVGMYLGYLGWDLVVVAVAFGALVGGIPAIVLLATRRAGRKDELAYGPALILGAWAALAVGRRFLAWYLG